MNGINTSQSADNRLVGHQIQNERHKHITIWRQHTSGTSNLIRMNGINTSQSADNRLVRHQIQNERHKHIIIWIDNRLVRHQIQNERHKHIIIWRQHTSETSNTNQSEWYRKTNYSDS